MYVFNIGSHTTTLTGKLFILCSVRLRVLNGQILRKETNKYVNIEFSTQRKRDNWAYKWLLQNGLIALTRSGKPKLIYSVISLFYSLWPKQS